MNGSIQYHAVCPNCQPQHHIGNTYGYIETTNHMYMPQQEGYFRFSLESDKILMLNVFLINNVVFLNAKCNDHCHSCSMEKPPKYDYRKYHIENKFVVYFQYLNGSVFAMLCRTSLTTMMMRESFSLMYH